MLTNYQTRITVTTTKVMLKADRTRVVENRHETIVMTCAANFKTPKEADKHHEDVVKALLIMSKPVHYER